MLKFVNICLKYIYELALFLWTTFADKDSISPQTFQGQVCLIQNMFVEHTL